MKTVTARMRIFSVPGAPALAMTATATESEVNSMIKNLGLRDKPVILRASPIQDHIKFSVVKRPPNNHGMDSELDSNGVLKAGLLPVLDTLYLKRFVENTLQGIPVKKCLMLFRTQKHMIDVHDYVREKLPNFKDQMLRPFIMNHGSIGPITSDHIINRKNEYDLFLSTRYIFQTTPTV